MGVENDVPMLPPPEPIQAGCWTGSGLLYCRQHIEKINTTGGSENRLLLVHGLFLIQGVEAKGSGVVKRLIPLPDVKKIMHDPTTRTTVVCVDPNASPPERDWHFKYSSSAGNSHRSLEEVVEVINRCRQSLMPPGTPLLKLELGITAPINDAKRPGVMTAKERLAFYNRNPDKLPKRRAVSKPQEAFGEPTEYWVVLDNPDEDLAFTLQNRAGKPVLITKITEGGPFHRAGCPPGEIVNFNRVPTMDHDTLKQAVHDTYGRQDTEFPVVIRHDLNNPPPPPYVPPMPPPYFGEPAEDHQPEELPEPAEMQPQPREVLESEGLTQSDLDDVPDQEEVLAGKLQKAANLRRKGVISDEAYLDTKEHYLNLLGAQSRRPSEDEISPSRPKTPPYPWAAVNIGRYIYLREGPSRASPWVVNGGVHGVLEAVHIIDDWCFVKADNGVHGYIRCKYLEFAPRNELATKPRRNKDESLRKHLSDLISEPPSERPMGSEYGRHLSAPNEYFDPVSGRWLPYSARRAPSQASSWGPSATRSSWHDPDLLFEASSREASSNSAKDIRVDELAWLTV
eukprot:TRINITY_DN1850_c0_g1_i3.p1 TRINITY_DN1850_c0_g1~~TRINITY_DN1850_c0_g1_i3.p1  ORF type:complete len:580 (+),score=194.03 TRINITY_DN1850_c0_g1_i3:40-1740(+)